MSNERIEQFRQIAHDAVESQNRLLSFWRACNTPEFSADCNITDVELLSELILLRIFPINAFSLLVLLDKERSIDVLLSRYIGRDVDPDTKYGGFEFELSSMLDDFFSSFGIDAISDIICRNNYSSDKIKGDIRIMRTLSHAVNVDESELIDFIQQRKDKIDPSK